MRILGIDPGLRITGFGVLDKSGQKLAYVTSGCIRTPQQGELSLRLKTILDGLAEVIAQCRDAALPWKATAGLHHPLSRFDEGQSVWVFGFVNVFMADALANVHRLDPKTVEAILTSQDAQDFAVAEEALAWRDQRATVSQITAARRSGLQSFGSCSFEEPCAGLKSLGWI